MEAKEKEKLLDLILWLFETIQEYEREIEELEEHIKEQPVVFYKEEE